MAWEYSEKTKQLFMDAVHGRPGTHLGEIKNADGFGEHGSIACGDALRFTFKVQRDASDPTRDRIVEAKYLTFGCTSAIAASEALCCLIEEGKFSPIDALKIKNEDIVDYLEGLPDQKIHCSVMGAEALEAAVADWARKRGVDLNEYGVELKAEDQEEGRIVCKCFTLSEPYLKRKIKELGLKSIDDIANAVKAGGACMSCHHLPGGLQDLLNEVWGNAPAVTATEPCPEPTPAVSSAEETLSPFQFFKKVESTIEEYVRPMLRRGRSGSDGYQGDLDLLPPSWRLFRLRRRKPDLENDGGKILEGSCG